MFKIFLMVVAITFSFSFSFAKEKGQSFNVKFNKQVFNRLSIPDKAKYLQAYVEFAKAMEKEKDFFASAVPERSVDQFLFELIFPKSYAAATRCLTGGIYYSPEPACATLPNGAINIPGIDQLFECGAKQRCAMYFGVDGSGNGFCWKNEGNATGDCETASKKVPEAQTNLSAKISACEGNPTATDCKAIREAMAFDLHDNAHIQTACLNTSAGSRRKACKRLGAFADTYAGKANGSLGEDPGAVRGQGCTSMETSLLAAQGEQFKNINPLYYQLAKSAGFGCPSESYQTILGRVGICSNMAAGEDNASKVDIEGVIRNNDNLAKVLKALESGKAVDRHDSATGGEAGWASFLGTFGITPVEFRKLFCETKSGPEFWAAAHNPQILENNPPGMALAGDVAKSRRAMFKECVEQTHTLKDVSIGNATEQRRNSNYNGSCSFRSAVNPSIAEMQNENWKGRESYYFQDSNGNCMKFHDAGATCQDVLTLPKEKALVGHNKLTCENTPAAATGQISSNSSGFVRLKPYLVSDNLDSIVSVDQFNAGFKAYEWSCNNPGSDVTPYDVTQ